MRIFGGARAASILNNLKIDENIPIELSIFSRQIESAQKKVESMHFDIRKNLVEYDDVLNQQREIIYKRRRFILNLFTDEEGLDKTDQRKEYIIKKLNTQIESIILGTEENGELDEFGFKKALTQFEDIVPLDLLKKTLKKIGSNYEEWVKLLTLSGKKVSSQN